MRWPRSHRDAAEIQITDDVARWRSDFEEPLPPVTRNELLNRLGMMVELDDSPVVQSASRRSESKVIAAA